MPCDRSVLQALYLFDFCRAQSSFLDRMRNENDQIFFSANYAPPSPFTFSPGQHAQRLQELKQGISPGSSPFNQGRPMYDKDAAPVEVIISYMQVCV